MKKLVASLFAGFPPCLRKHKVAKLLLRAGLLDIHQTTSFNGNAVASVNIRDAEARNVFLTHLFEPAFFEVVAPFCKDAKVIFDIGANSGFCTFGIAAQVQTPAEFHLFEASSTLVSLLEKSIRLQPPLHSFKIAQGCVSDQAGFSGIEFSEDYLCAHVTGKGSIPNIVLDSYVDQHTIPTVDFLKMDIEGSELAALRGFSKFLNEHRVRAMYVEVCEGTLKSFGATTKDLIQLIEGFGYKCFYCKEPELSRQPIKKTIHVNGSNISIAPCTSDSIPPDFQSDVLAFPAESNWISNI